jgi:DNA polymerase I-like protein with 3'-5' exonuclease and polymerase domains
MSMVEYFYNNQPIEDDFETPAHEFFTRNFGNFNNLNTIIPISKHIEKSQAISQRFLDVFDFYQNDTAFEKYNVLMLDSLQQIEQNGLFVNYEQFKKKFTEHLIHDNFVYSEYNIYTTTGRPSNRYGGINFAALNKDNGQRASFVSRFGENGFMLSFDYDAYHLRLLAELVDYKFPDNVSVHQYLGQFYFDKETLSPEEYSESKSISFKQLYGGIGSEYLTIPFFAKIHEYTQLIWNQFKEQGYIETPMFSRKLFKSFFTEMNAAKLLNYMLQSFETERNMAVIHNILLRTKSFSSKLILYTYDSFLYDFDKRDGADLLHIIKEELEQQGKYPTKIEIGPDYSNMISVERKF